MESAKIIKRIAIGLLCLASLSSIGFNIYQYHQIRNVVQGMAGNISPDEEVTTDMMPDESAPVSNNTNQNPVLASAEIQPLNNEAEDLKYQIAAAKEELAMIKKELDDDAVKEAEEKKARLEAQKRSQEVAKTYREDPNYKKMMRNSMRNSLSVQYPDLFKKLNLSAEKLDKFKDMLVDEMMAQQELWTGVQTNGSTPLSKEQQTELNQRSEALNKEYESKKSEFLGKDGYDEYLAYNETAGERYSVASFMGSLGSSENLTETQKEDLIEAMHEEVKNVVYEPVDPETSSSATQKEVIARQMEYQSRRDEAYLRAAKGILSASQYSQLETYLEKQSDNLKLMMETSSMYITETGEESEDKKSE